MAQEIQPFRGTPPYHSVGTFTQSRHLTRGEINCAGRKLLGRKDHHQRSTFKFGGLLYDSDICGIFGNPFEYIIS